MLFPPRIVSVLLPQPLPEPFDYELPEGLDAPLGSFVVVPLGAREMIGVVWGVRSVPSNRKLKPVLEVISAAPPLPESMRSFIERAARYICAPVGNVLAMAMRSRAALDEPPDPGAGWLRVRTREERRARREATND